MKTVQDVLKTLEDKEADFPQEFTDGYYKFRLDYSAKKSLNKTFDAEFKAVYREVGEIDKYKWEEGSVRWDSEHVYIVTSKHNLVLMYNSEWSTVEKVK